MWTLKFHNLIQTSNKLIILHKKHKRIYFKKIGQDQHNLLIFVLVFLRK